MVSGCSFFKSEDEAVPVARVFDKYLYLHDIQEIIPEGITAEDSATMAENYINKWIRQTLILHKAESNLAEEHKKFEKKMEDYRRSLIIYAYERELIDQKLDTLISQEEIEKYYNNNKQNFELKDNIIKVRYIKLDKKAPQIEKVRKWYISDDHDDMINLESYCYQFAQNFYMDDKTWLLFDDLLKEIPIKTYDKEEFLKQNRFIEVQDSIFYYFVNIKGFRTKNSLSPLSFEKKNIRNILINQQKLELINKMKNDIYEDALLNKDFEIFSAN